MATCARWRRRLLPLSFASARGRLLYCMTMFLLFVIRFRNTYTKHRSLRGANVRCSDSIPCGLTTGSWNWLVCQVEHYQRATALDGSRLHWLGTGPAVVVGFDASSLLPCQVVLGRVGSSPQVFGLGVIELARTMSRGPRARNGQNHVFNRCDGSVMTGAMPAFPLLRHRALSCRSISHSPYKL